MNGRLERAERWTGWRLALRIVAFLVAWLALDLLAWQIAYAPEGGYPYWWPAGGLTLGMLLRAPRRVWVAILASLAGLLIVLGLVNFPAVAAPPVSLGIVLLVENLISPLVGAWALEQRHPGRLTLLRVREILVFLVFGAFVAGATSVVLLGIAARFSAVRHLAFSAVPFWSGYVLGGLVAAPLVLTLPSRYDPPLARRRGRELAALAACFLLAIWAAFRFPFLTEDSSSWAAQHGARLALASALFLLLAWAAIRFGSRGAAWSGFALTTLGIWFTGLGYGPYGAQPTYERIAFGAAFFSLACIGSLITAALAAEGRRQRARQLLLLRIDRLEGQDLQLREKLAATATYIWESTFVSRCEIRIGSLQVGHPAEPAPSDDEAVELPIQPGTQDEGSLVLWARPTVGGFDEPQRSIAELLAARIGTLVTRDRLRREVADRTLRIEEALAFLDAVIGSAPIGIGIFDRSLKCIRFNHAFAELHPCPGASLVDGRESGLGVVGGEWDELLRKVYETGRPIVARQIEVHDERRQASRWLSCTFFPIHGSDPRGVCAFVLDRTERVVGEAERARLYAEAQEAIHARDAFLSAASHELRTPLTPLQLRLQNVRRFAEAGRPIEPEWIVRCLGNVDRLRRLIDGILDVTRLQAGGLHLHGHPVDLGAVVRDVVERTRGPGFGHSIELGLPAEPTLVLADGARLRQIVHAVLDNAIKFSPADSTVRIRVVSREGEAILSISDEGIGVPDEDQPYIFDQFARGSNVPGTAYGGLGLSLYHVRRMLEAMRGRIWLSSTRGAGSTFFVALPLLSMRTESSSQGETPNAPEGLW